MHTLEIPERNINLEIPSHWDEMNQVQRDYCIKQAVWASLGIIGPEEAKLRCLYFLLDIERDWKSVANDRIFDHHTVLDKYSKIYLICEEIITFLFSVNEKGQFEVNYNTVYNYYPEIRVKKFKPVDLIGPAHLLADLSFGEFRAAIEEMNEYFANKSEESLNRMIACLYRPQRIDYKMALESDDFDGQRRERFNRNRIGINAVLVSHMDPVTKAAILLWFTYTMGFIQKEDLEIGGSSVNFSPLFPRKENSKGEEEDSTPRGQGYGWVSVLNRVAKDGPFGNVAEVDKVGLFDLLLYMLETKEENDRIKSKTKKK